MQKLDMLSPDLVVQNLDKIAELFPQVITEREDENGNIVKAIDYDLFRQMFSREVVEGGEERYRLDWPGKRASILKANTPINKTLRPVVEDSVSWETTGNLYIEGDNFEVLKVLQESYLGKVKMVYIDPPYNTGKDFVYTDNFKISKENYEEGLDIVDEEGGRLVRNTDTNGRFHSDWLSMMYERLVVARDLLRDDGVIFMSIDDNEVHNLRKIADEVFGEENLMGMMVWHVRGRSKTPLSIDHEYVLVYAKSLPNIIPIFDTKGKKPTWYGQYIERKYSNPDNDKRGDWRDCQHTVTENKAHYTYSINIDSGEVVENEDRSSDKWYYHKTWMYPIGTIKKLFTDNRLFFTLDSKNKKITLKVKKFKTEEESVSALEGLVQRDYVSSRNGSEEFDKLFPEGKIFDYPKATLFLKRLIQSCTFENDLILDFFSGSASTGDAVFKSNLEDSGNRKFIMVQIAENTDKESAANKVGYRNICEIGKERIRRAGKKILEDNKGKEGIEKLDIGFRVYKLDDSNMKDVYYHPTAVKQSALFELTSNIKEDRTPEDLLAQVMLDLGLTLDLPIETRTVAGSTVYFVAGNSLVACFDEKIDFAIVDELAPLSPLKVVFRDNSFRSDADRINFETRFKKLSPDTVLQVL